MKRYSLFFVFFLALFSACQKPIVFVEGSGPGDGTIPGNIGGNNNKAFMKAKVNGLLVECNIVTGALFEFSATESVFQISGFKGNEGLSITINDYKGIGTYELVDNIGSYIGNISDPNTAYFSETGTVRITEATAKYAKGVFEFKSVNGAGEQKTITEGQFMVNFEKVDTPDPGTSGSKITVKMDGVSTSFDGQIVQAGATNIVGMAGTKTFTLGIFDFKGVGTYDVVDKINEGAAIYYNPDVNTTYRSISGKITVTSSTPDRIVGTFEGVLKLENSNKTIQLTSGSFDVEY